MGRKTIRCQNCGKMKDRLHSQKQMNKDTNKLHHIKGKCKLTSFAVKNLQNNKNQDFDALSTCI